MPLLPADDDALKVAVFLLSLPESPELSDMNLLAARVMAGELRALAHFYAGTGTLPPLLSPATTQMVFSAVALAAKRFDIDVPDEAWLAFVFRVLVAVKQEIA